MQTDIQTSHYSMMEWQQIMFSYLVFSLTQWIHLLTVESDFKAVLSATLHSLLARQLLIQKNAPDLSFESLSWRASVCCQRGILFIPGQAKSATSPVNPGWVCLKDVWGRIRDIAQSSNTEYTIIAIGSWSWTCCVLPCLKGRYSAILLNTIFS